MTKLCLASCFLPLNDENCRWWIDFQTELTRRGMELVLISAAQPSDKTLRVITVPLWLQGYRQAYTTPSAPVTLEEPLARALAQRDRSWAKQEHRDLPEFLEGVGVAQHVLRSILNELQPSVVLTWGSSLPQSVVLQQLALQQGRPCWVLERGLVPGTLMLEMTGHGGYSELNWSFTVNQAIRAANETEHFHAARAFASSHRANKYTQAPERDSSQLKQQLNADGRKVVALLLQHDGSSSLTPATYAGTQIHAPGIQSSAQAIRALSQAIADRADVRLVVKPHPMDGDDYSQFQSEDVIVSRDMNLQSLIEASDVVACMCSSTQFEALLQEKPILLLARSGLSGKGIAYEAHDCAALPTALSAAISRESFSERMENGRRFLDFILKHHSISLGAAPAGSSLGNLADFLHGNALPASKTNPVEERISALKEQFHAWERKNAVPVAEFIRGRHLLEVFRVRDFNTFNQLWKGRFDQIIREQDALLPAIGDTQPFKLIGTCVVCGKEESFTTDFMFSKPDAQGRVRPAWRERQICRCGLNCRQRSCFHVLTECLGLSSDSLIYCTEQQGTLFNRIRQLFPRTTGSEYLGNRVPLGTTTPEGLRNEDITQLTYPDASFDCVFSLDVMEHVPNYKAGFREMARCLKPGGKLLLTAPFHFHKEQTVIRATVNPDGTLTHHLPEVYHGDPINPKGALCFNDFGWDILEDLRAVGFADATVFVFTAPHYGYIGFQYVILATRQPVEANANSPQSFALPATTLPHAPKAALPELPVSVTALKDEALELLKQGKWAGAIRHLQALTRLAPDEVTGWHARIACARKLGHEVLERLIRDEALERHPEWSAKLNEEFDPSGAAGLEPAEIVEGRSYGE